MSISDDFLSKQAQAPRYYKDTWISYLLLTNDFLSEELSAEDATHKSFMEKRHRHSSVPQTVKPTGPVQGGGFSFCLFVLRSVYLLFCFTYRVFFYWSALNK